MNVGAPRYAPITSGPAERGRLVAWLSAAVRAADLAAESGHRFDQASNDGVPLVTRPASAELDVLHFDARSLADLPALAEGHGVAAQLAPAALGRLPAAVREAIADAAARTIARGARLAQERQLVANALESSGVPFRWLKGAWLAGLTSSAPLTPIGNRVAGDWPASRWSRRPAADIDLLVPAGAGPDAARALQAIGYLGAHRTARHEVFLRPGDHTVADYRGEHPANPMPVEVHARLGESFRGIGVDWTERASFADAASAHLLPLPLGLLHLAAHATVDALNRRLRLSALFDLEWLAAILTAADWSVVSELGTRPEAARFVWPSLAMAFSTPASRRSLPSGGHPVPPDVLAGLARHVRPALKAWVAASGVDQASRFGRRDASRRLDEVFAIWPLGVAEWLRIWRFIVVPDRWELADRYPALALSQWWPLMYFQHAGYNLKVLRRRWSAARR